MKHERYLTAVVVDGQYKIAQYGSYGGSPGYSGLIILDFLGETNLSAFRDEVRHVQLIDNWQLKGSERLPHWMKADVGSDILELVADGQVDKVINDVQIAKHSGVCRWGYGIDLDRWSFEIYKGLQPPSKRGRFGQLQTDAYGRFGPAFFAEIPKTRGPIQMIRSYSLTNLPTEEAFFEEVGDE